MQMRNAMNACNSSAQGPRANARGLACIADSESRTGRASRTVVDNCAAPRRSSGARVSLFEAASEVVVLPPGARSGDLDLAPV